MQITENCLSLLQQYTYVLYTEFSNDCINIPYLYIFSLFCTSFANK